MRRKLPHAAAAGSSHLAVAAAIAFLLAAALLPAAGASTQQLAARDDGVRGVVAGGGVSDDDAAVPDAARDLGDGEVMVGPPQALLRLPTGKVFLVVNETHTRHADRTVGSAAPVGSGARARARAFGMHRGGAGDGAGAVGGSTAVALAPVPSAAVAWALGFDPDNATLVTAQDVALLPPTRAAVDPSPLARRSVLAPPLALGWGTQLRFPAATHIGGFSTVSAWVWLWEAPSATAGGQQVLLWTSTDTAAPTAGRISPAALIGFAANPGSLMCAAVTSHRTATGMLAEVPFPVRQWVHLALVVDEDVLSWCVRDMYRAWQPGLWCYHACCGHCARCAAPAVC